MTTDTDLDQRRLALQDLIELRRPIPEAIAELDRHEWDGIGEPAPLAPLRRRHLRRLLDSYLDAAASADEVALWASALAARRHVLDLERGHTRVIETILLDLSVEQHRPRFPLSRTESIAAMKEFLDIRDRGCWYCPPRRADRFMVAAWALAMIALVAFMPEGLTAAFRGILGAAVSITATTVSYWLTSGRHRAIRNLDEAGPVTLAAIGLMIIIESLGAPS